MINYCHRFLPGIAPKPAPLHAASAGRGKNISWTPQYQKHLRKPKVHYLTVHYFITHGPMQKPALLWTHLIPPLERSLNNYKGVVGCQLLSFPGSCLSPRKTTVHLTASYRCSDISVPSQLLKIK